MAPTSKVKDLVAKTGAFMAGIIESMTPAKQKSYLAGLKDLLAKAVVKATKKKKSLNVARAPPTRETATAPSETRMVGSLDFKFEVEFKGKNVGVTFLKDISVPWDAPRAPTQEDINRAADEELKRLLEDSPIVRAKEVPAHRKVLVVRMATESSGIVQRKARDANALPISGYDLSADSGKGRCVFDWVRERYEATNKTLCRSDEFIGAVMTGAMGVRGEPSFQSPTVANLQACFERHKDVIWRWFAEGVAAEQLQRPPTSAAPCTAWTRTTTSSCRTDRRRPPGSARTPPWSPTSATAICTP
jgi:hypothetical protein